MTSGIFRALGVLLLSGVFAGPAIAQVCPAGTYKTFAALSGQSGTSETLINNSNTYVGDTRLQAINTATGGASFSNNTIDANHFAGEPGIRIGHNDTSASAPLVTTLDFRDPGNLTVWRPVSNLTLRLHDIDAGDNVTVNAYDQNGTLINLVAANYSFDSSNGTPLVSYAGGNRFTSGGSSGDSANNQRRGTVNLTFAALQVRRIEFRYYDTTDTGTYTIAELNACSVPVTLFKVTQPSAGGPFGFTLTNTTLASGTASTAATGTPVQVDGNATAGTQPFTVTAPGTAVTINESSLPTGWSLVNATCSNAAGTTVGSRSGTSYTLPAASTVAGEVLTCTFTNALTTLRLQKSLPVGRAVAADQFTLRIASGATVLQSATTTGSTNAPTQLATLSPATAGTAYTLSEIGAGGANLANYTTSYSCTNTRPGGQTPSGTGTSFNVTPVAGDDLTCTFSNVARPRVTIRKTSVNGTGSFTFSGSNGIANETLATTVAGTPVAGATQLLTAANTVTTITEGVPPANYRLTDITCTGLASGGVATPDLAARQVSLDAAATAAGANIVCTFTNTLQQTDVRVQKTATPNPALSGGVVTYTITVANAGPEAANETIVTDTPGAGLNCTTPSTTLACSATGNAACPSATVPVSTLTGSGLAIPALPAGGQVTLTLQCTVVATGQP